MLTCHAVLDFRMDPPDLRILFRCCAHVHAPIPSSRKVGRVGLSVVGVCAGRVGADHLRYAHVSDGRAGRV
jgi:hypothetical protein